MSGVVIIGGVAGGATAAGRLRRLDPNVKITMLEKGEYISFANCGLPYYIGGKVKSPDDILFETPESFGKKYNIDIRVKNQVTDINTKSKTLTVFDHNSNSEWSLPYDKLLISTGAKPISEGFPGIDQKGVFVLRSYSDALNIRKYIEDNNVKNAVIVGSGFIGLEMLESFVELGISTKLIQRSEHIFSQIDSDMIGTVEEHIVEKGVDLKINTEVSSVKREEDNIILTTSQGENIETEIVLFAVGIIPDNDIAKKAGLKLGYKQGIVVNKKMETSVADIYAIGDVIEVKNYVTGRPDHIPLAGPTHMQARVVVKNMLGIPAVYNGSQGSSILKIFGLTIASTGLNEPKAKDAGYDYDFLIISSPSHASYYPGAESMTMKLIYEKITGKVLGAQIIGGAGTDKRGDIIATAIYAGLTVRHLEEIQLLYAPPYSIPRDIVNIAAGIIVDKLDAQLK